MAEHVNTYIALSLVVYKQTNTHTTTNAHTTTNRHDKNTSGTSHAQIFFRVFTVSPLLVPEVIWNILFTHMAVMCPPRQTGQPPSI